MRRHPRNCPDYEGKAEDKMTEIKARIGNGLKTGELTTNQTRRFLRRLDLLETDLDQSL